jgi:hypothetical protein
MTTLASPGRWTSPSSVPDRRIGQRNPWRSPDCRDLHGEPPNHHGAPLHRSRLDGLVRVGPRPPRRHRSLRAIQQQAATHRHTCLAPLFPQVRSRQPNRAHIQIRCLRKRRMLRQTRHQRRPRSQSERLSWRGLARPFFRILRSRSEAFSFLGALQTAGLSVRTATRPSARGTGPGTSSLHRHPNSEIRFRTSR